MPDKVHKVEDPSPSQFWWLALVVAVVLIIIGIIILFIGKFIAGVIIALLGAAFGVGSQVSKNKNLQL